MNERDLQSRLERLGPERLAETLMELAFRYDAVRDCVERLVAMPRENVSRFKRGIAALAKSNHYVDWRQTRTFAGELEGLLSDIRAGVTDPEEGVELVRMFFRSDGRILERCDDSDGTIGDIFRSDACDLFVGYASRCEIHSAISDIVLDLYMDDGYGVRAALLERVSEFLPPEQLRLLAERLWDLHLKHKADEHQSRHVLIGIELLAQQLRDPALFEKARLAMWPTLSTAACVDIGRAYLDAGDATTALSWLERIDKAEQFMREERDDLLFLAYEQSGDRDNAKEVAWRVFRRLRNERTLAQLLSVLGSGERGTVVDEQTAEILAAPQFSYIDARFLIDMGRIDEAEAYLLRNVGHFNGDYYSYLLPLAESMEQPQRWLPAVAIYRACLDSILARARSKHYHHGVRYLKTLDFLAPKVANWRSVPPHDQYKKSLRQDHARKHAFWSRYE